MCYFTFFSHSMKSNQLYSYSAVAKNTLYIASTKFIIRVYLSTKSQENDLMS